MTDRVQKERKPESNTSSALAEGPILAEDDEIWSRQVTGSGGHRWMIRVRVVRMEPDEFYECWVNAILLPAHWRRERTHLQSVFEAGSRFIHGHRR